MFVKKQATINDDVLDYTNDLEDRIYNATLIQSGFATVSESDGTTSYGGMTYHLKSHVVVFDVPYERVPSISLAINSPSTWGITVGYTGVSRTGFKIHTSRINEYDTPVSWTALPR